MTVSVRMPVEPLRVTVSVSGALVNNFMFGVCVRVRTEVREC